MVGSHLGAHIAGVHWLFRRGVPLRLLVQRPRHVSSELNRRFDAGGIHPQVEMFLRRDLSPAVAVERVFRARSALRDGLAIYLNGDIPWSGPNTCPGDAAGPSPAPAGHLDRAGRAYRHAGLSRVLHPPARAAASHSRSKPWATCGPARKKRPSLITSSSSKPGSRPRPADAVAHLVWPCYESPSLLHKQIRHRKILGSRQRSA